MKHKRFALCMMGVLATGVVYGNQPNAEKSNIKPKPPIYLDQQWTDAERQKFYFTPQGSYLIPYAWYLALESANNHQFNDPKNIRRYGYLVDEQFSSANADRLPVGFAKEPVVQGEAWLGYTCAACHTNDIRYKGQTVRIDGAPTMADFTAFMDGLNAALDSTLQNKKRFNRFARAVLGKEGDTAEKATLLHQVTDHTDWLKGFANRSRPTHAYGAGRVDAFGVIMNEVFARDLGVPENVKVPDAPVSYPFLWGTPQHDNVQWNGSASNPFGRNVGEVLGTFGRVNLDITSPEFGKTTARARELFELERLVAKLDKPRWPEALLGHIDQASAFRGQVLYTQYRHGEESCADCHSLPDSAGRYPSTPLEENLFGISFIKTQMIPLNEIGTDPLMAKNFALRSVKTGNVAPILPAPFTNASELPAPLLLSILVGTAAQNSILEAQPPFSQLESIELIGYRQKAAGLPPYSLPNLLAYRARPLDGIWATAPYLHNGSVPSLYELLLPPAQRRQVFYVGNREFDTDNVGFKSGRCNHGFRLDTQLPGNSNAGHAYGTDLNDDERRDLLEFMKTL
jgi:hypothetical protein